MDQVFGDNWYASEVWGGGVNTRWISNDAILSIPSGSPRMVFNVNSFYRPRLLKVYLNEELIFEKEIPTRFIKVALYLKPGKLRFHSADGTFRPIDIPELQSSDLRNLSFAFQNIQFSRIIPINYHKYPLKINLGCGFDKLSGYLNIDLHEFHKPDLVADIRDLSMLPSGLYEEILAQDVLEHLPQVDIEPVLEEWHRLLKRGGILKIRVPNLIGVLKLLESSSDQEELMRCVYGTQAYEGDYHLSGFTPNLIRDYLKDFNVIEIKEKDDWLMEVIAKK